MTRILSTLGPSSLNKTTVQKMTKSGVSLFRINLSHTELEDLEKIISDLRQWTNVPVCLDSEGAQVRNGYMVCDQIFYEKDALVRVHGAPVRGDEENISLTPLTVFAQLQLMDEIQVDFNSVLLRLESFHEDYFLAKVIKGGGVGSNKGVVVNRSLNLPAVTSKDRSAIEIGLRLGVRNYALSFTHTPEDVKQIRDLIGGMNLISKIESTQGVLNIQDILPLVDQILIDRGDLSREVPIEKIPFVQRKLISIARSCETPVYVATNLLESMIYSATPTRAEANDVASTLLMGASGLVLAAETAVGKYPVEAVNMIQAIVGHYEKWSHNTNLEELMVFD